MAVILGAMTTVTIDGESNGFQSISWNINRQPNRLWQLGSWNPWRTQVGTTLSINVTSYAEALDPIDLEPSTSCVDSTAVKRIVINADTCSPGGAINVDEDKMFLNSYSYSKGDPIGFGTESWSFQKWIESGVAGATFINIPDPTYVLQGRSEGTRNGDVGNGTTDMGVRFIGEGGPGGLAYADHVVVGQTGNVSAGFPGQGSADDIEQGLVNRVGGGLLESGGNTGQSSATIPHVPLYLGT